MIKQFYLFLRSGLSKKEKYFLAYGILCVTFFITYTTSLPYFFKIWIDKVFSGANSGFSGKAAALLIAGAAVATLADLLGAYFLIKVRENSRAQIRLKLINQLQKMPINEVEGRESGYFTEVLLSDVETATGMIVSFVYMVVPAVISLPISVYWSFKLSIYFSIIGITGLVLIGANLYFFSPIIRRLSSKRQDLYSKASGIIQESVFANFFIRLSQIEEQIAARNSIVLNSLRDESIKKHVTDYAAGSVERFITQALQVTAVFIGLYAAVQFDKSLTATGIMAGIFYLLKIWAPINLFSSLNADFQGSLASAKRISDIIESKVEIQSGTTDLGKEIDNIQCEKLSVYIGSRKLIDNLDLTINRGSVVGLKGKSGCGKTTLLKTLLGFYPSWTGAVKYNGISLKDIKNSSLLNLSGYMPHDVCVFRENIFFNIALNSEYDASRMRDTLRKFHLERLYNQTGDKTLIPANISAGEKKRIGLARLYYSSKELIILDEPFSGLDAQTREAIYDEITSSFADKTIIIVSHYEQDLSRCSFKIELK